jgi:hypothetical protein
MIGTISIERAKELSKRGIEQRRREVMNFISENIETCATYGKLETTVTLCSGYTHVDKRYEFIEALTEDDFLWIKEHLELYGYKVSFCPADAIACSSPYFLISWAEES